MTCADRRSDRSCGAVPVGLALIALTLIASGCSSESKQVKRVAPSAAIVRDVPRPLQGIIGAEATLRGIDPTLISGLGIVVGLAGTGGADNLDPAVQATMERELARGGIAKGGTIQNYPGFEGISPQQFLRSPDVAVVIVEAKVAPGAPEGMPFDVYVRTLPGSGVTSLEGGTLWTTDLHIGPAAVFGAIKSRKIGAARGPVFINPFSAPSVNSQGDVQITRTSGRVLGGGRVTSPLQIEMALDNDSFARARSIVSTINSRFPRGPGDDGPIARGRGNGGGTSGYQSIALRIPQAYAEKPEEFLQLVRHMRVDPSSPEEFARQYVEYLKATPELTEDLCWCLQAIGKPALPFLAQMYDYPELRPRFAALRAGARLGDPRATPALIDLARKASPADRIGALRLLADMPADPRINLAMREIVNDPNLDIRVAAYEGLRDRNDPMLLRVPIGETSRARFTLELLPAKEPMVYVTQQGDPRIVLFGGIDPSAGGSSGSKYNGIQIRKPALLSVWDDRFMLSAESANSDLRVYYRDPRSNQVTQSKAPEDLAEFVEFLAHRSTPENPQPGLGMTYSQVVGVLYAMCPRAGEPAATAAGVDPRAISALPATFATEEDRLRAEIYQAMQSTMLADRPENEAQAADQADAVFRPTAPVALPSAGPSTGDGDMKSKIVPLKKAAPGKSAAAR